MLVTLRKFDLSKGWAKWLSIPLLWTYIDGIWHVSIIVNDTEIAYNCTDGITTCEPDNDDPYEEIILGYTRKSVPDIAEFLERAVTDRFSVSNYNLLTRNCIHFANLLSSFLLNKQIPDNIVNLPKKIHELRRWSLLVNVIILKNENLFRSTSISGSARSISGSARPRPVPQHRVVVQPQSNIDCAQPPSGNQFQGPSDIRFQGPSSNLETKRSRFLAADGLSFIDVKRGMNQDERMRMYRIQYQRQARRN